MNKTTDCLVCGNSAFNDYCTAKDFLVSGEEFIIGQCNECGFVFTVNPPDEKDIFEYYLSEDYISHSDRKKNLTDVLYHFARNMMLTKKYKLITRVCERREGKLLDIGSGSGYFAGFMRKKGWDPTGIEISERARIYAASKFDIDFIAPDKTQALPDHSFDCVTLWHVLEHLYDPKKWFSEINRVLKKNGKCFLALPNISSSDAKWFGKNWAALDVPRHLSHFSPDTFTKLAYKYGFRCIKIKSLPLDLFYISILSYKNLKQPAAFMRGTAIAAMLAFKNTFSQHSASSLMYVIEKNQ